MVQRGEIMFVNSQLGIERFGGVVVDRIPLNSSLLCAWLSIDSFDAGCIE